MTAETFLIKYIDIETKCFIKTDKHIRLDNLINESFKKNELTSFEDVRYIVTELIYKEIKIRMPFFLKVIYPVLSNQIDQDNVEAIKLMIRLESILIGVQKLTNDNKYSYSSLIEKGLSLDPNDKELLENKELKLRNYISYSLHEIPLGVLYESNGASIEECNDLIDTLKKYNTICDKLKIDNSELINKARFYYQAYKEYLQIFKQYNGFAHYLKELK